MQKVKNIIIVEDDPISRLLIKSLVNKNYKVDQSDTFLNGQEALNYIKENIETNRELPDLILLDINMPVMDGWEFLEEISQIEKVQNIPVVMLTSSIDSEDEERSKTFKNVIGYYYKPLSKDNLNKIMMTRC